MQIQLPTIHSENDYLKITISTENNRFSITGKTVNSCGCLHEEILLVRPDLKPFVDLHLSTLEGIPMHAVENGFYWLAKAAGIPQKYEPEQSPEKCFDYLCNHLRVSAREGSTLQGEIIDAYLEGKAKIALSSKVSPRTMEEQEKAGIQKAKTLFTSKVKKMKPRWKQEATKALELLESIK